MNLPRKKILLLTTQLGYGGAETSFIRLANFLAQSMEVQVALFSGDYGAGAYALGHEPLHAPVLLLDSPTPCGRLRRWWQRIRRVRQLKRGQDATISFLSGPNLVNVLAGHNHRSIVSLRGSRRYDPVASPTQRTLFQHLIDPLIFRLAARIVPVSAGLGNEVRAAAGSKALAKICVISPFLRTETLAARLAEPVEEHYAALRGQAVIVATGRLSVEKGFHHLIRVVAALGASHAGVKLLLVGDGPELPALRALCTRLEITMDITTQGIPSVLFAGYQKNPLPLMALGRVYALTSATEGFPSVLLEAMAAGVPVVAADAPWGARAILHPSAPPTAEPYPTMQPTQTDYGTLLPPIAPPEHEAAWVRCLAEHLAAAPSVPPSIAERVAAHDIAPIGAQWVKLIESLP